MLKGKEMLLEGKYSEFNIRNLAKACNLGLGTIYNYFSGKEDLAREVFRSDWDKTLKLVEELKGSDMAFKEKLRMIYSSLETFIGQYMSIFVEMADDGLKPAGTGGEYEARCVGSCGGRQEKTHQHTYYIEIYSKVKELIDEGKKSGSINTNMDSGKLSYFIMINIFNVIKYRHLTFDEMYECIRI